MPGRRWSDGLHQAIDRTRDDLIKVKEGIREKMGQESSFIFEAHLLILDDFGMRKFTALEAEDFREMLEERSRNN
jgi:DNA replication protein DnaC